MVSATKKTLPSMAAFTPMSRTLPALSRNWPSSTSGRPKSLTSNAPATLNRSVIVVFICAFNA